MDDKNSDYTYTDRVIAPMKDRSFKFGQGKISAALACSLGVMSFLAVLCFKFPEYLTTAELRAGYNVDLSRLVLKVGMFAALGFSVLTFAIGNFRKLGAIGALFTLGGFALGGYNIQTGPVGAVPIAFGLDWLVLAFIVSAVLFIFLEKVFPKYKEQAILRPDWELDSGYFAFNHLLITVLLLIGNHFVTTYFGWAVHDGFQAWVQALPIGVQVIALILAADFVLYWCHRAYHEDPRLWKMHAVHHSVEYMDWMAGSRNHIFQTLFDRCMVLIPLYLLGASKEALDLYVSFAAFQAVWVHSNVNIPVGPLKYILCTPQFHHWHHSSEQPAIDTNYAVHLSLYDRLFGTYHMPGKHWPAHYGTVSPIPKTFTGQFLHPLRKDKDTDLAE